MPEINSGNPINDTGSRPIHSRSRFNNSYRLAGTYRFGEYQPHFVADVIPNDNHVLNSGHVVRSYTLGQPMMQGIDMKKDYFFVPLSAIIPNNYEKFITTPNIGDDVNAALVGTTVVGLPSHLRNFFSSFYTYIQSIDSVNYPEVAITAACKYVVLLDMILSDGGLLSSLGCHLAYKNPAETYTTIDSAVDAFWSKFSEACSSSPAGNFFTFGSDTILVGKSPSISGQLSISVREALCRMRDDFDFSLDVWSEGDVTVSDLFSYLPVVNNYLDPDPEAPIDLGRLFSYQIACAHFYSNDHVDYIYTAELYRQNVQGILNSFNSLGTPYFAARFTYNGVEYYYDTLSAYYFRYYISTLFATSNNFSSYYTTYGDSFFNYLRLIFGYNRSLRFVDYFTGSRTQPLAVGNAAVAVNNGYVNVVDTIQKRWYIKLWNQVNRVGRKMSEQMKGMFPGVRHVQDYHEPIWLGHTSDNIHSEEVDNTGDLQASTTSGVGTISQNLPVTASFNSNANRYAFDIEVPDYYGYVIGITYFDISRFYSRNIERTFFNVDRFDKFNPFLQFNGDQKVYLKELVGNAPYSDSYIFGYQGAYMEMKQRVNEAFGGFINDSLPGMLFLADEGRYYFSIGSIGPDYIRSYPAELDRFYKSLTGYSLGTYFHFIVISNNNLESNRPMAANPQID